MSDPRDPRRVLPRRRMRVGPAPAVSSANPGDDRRGFLRRAAGLVAGAATLGLAARRAHAAPQSSFPYVGEIMIFTGTYAPVGWLECNGQILPIAQYETLFFLIGTTYGGDGENTFALPDLRGCVPLHRGQGPGLTSRSLGESGGREAVALGPDQLPVHAHGATAQSTPGTAATPTGLRPARNLAGALHYATSSNASLAAGAVGEAGNGQPHPNVQPMLTVRFCIATDGIWPSPS